VPLSLVADYAGGGMLLAFGMVSALLEARITGHGQVVDAAMLDGAALLMASVYGRHAAGRWSLDRGRNFMDGAAHYYTTYQCADGKWLSVGSIEPAFYALLLERCGIADESLRDQSDPRRWGELKDRLQEIFATRSRDEWCALLEGTDACVAPVLNVAEAPLHPHNLARKSFYEANGQMLPAPAPRFLGTPAATPGSPATPGRDGREVLQEHGWGAEDIDALQASGALYIP
jgi:alpha-methylacyl-CoA racemase